MAEIRGNKVSFDPDNLVLTAGATSANETLIFCLADPGEAFLLPTPYYPGYVPNIILYLDVYLITLIQIKYFENFCHLIHAGTCIHAGSIET